MRVFLNFEEIKDAISEYLQTRGIKVERVDLHIFDTQMTRQQTIEARVSVETPEKKEGGPYR